MTRIGWGLLSRTVLASFAVEQPRAQRLSSMAKPSTAAHESISDMPIATCSRFAVISPAQLVFYLTLSE
jgi:hypothetical protein